MHRYAEFSTAATRKVTVNKYEDFTVPFTWVAKLDAVDFVLCGEQNLESDQYILV